MWEHECDDIAPVEVLAVAVKHGWRIKRSKRDGISILESPKFPDGSISALAIPTDERYSDRTKMMMEVVAHVASWLLRKEISVLKEETKRAIEGQP